MEKYKLLNKLKDDLENFELYLREIESLMALIEKSEDVDLVADHKLRLAQIKQNIAYIGSPLKLPFSFSRKLIS